MKKFVATILILAMLSAAPVNAAVRSESQTEYQNVNGVRMVSESESQIQPYFIGLNSLVSSLTNSGAVATCASAVTILRDGYNADLTMTLQRSKDQSSWEDVTSWSTTLTGVGGESLSKKYYLTSGYYYKSQAVATVTTSSGSYIETVSLDSKTIQY